MKKIICGLVVVLAVCFGNAHAACARKALSVYGLERTGIVCAPPSGAMPAPAVLAFHGRGGSAEEMAAGTRLHVAWPEALVVYLDGLPGNPAPYDPEGLKRGWQINIGDMNDRDVGLTDAALDALGRHYNIDRQRVFAVGHSNGARFVGILWALRSDRFAAVAFSAGQADKLIKGVAPRPAFMGMGLHDDMIPFDWQRQSIKYAAARFGIAPSEVERPGINSAKSQDGIELMTFIHRGGHIWPAEQTRLIVEFFRGKMLKQN
ncbi:hypothetical protein [Janthinobacterium sp. 17J80-10]|uniref:alpha/beta hydrolase family esterase n=1 Tax=Janthinobacterium sp. 17J80-10 TaxID=2497863 RepID=UPI001005568E|nr:hypothetical protein [Janthinobacterium sp. 17J80-10]QAU32901.1 hypothetical protein EKL02_01215 [Janthinobacterium sp. 17J80-10]